MVDNGVGITSNLVLDFLQQEATTKLFYTFLILTLGFIFSRISTKIIKTIYRISKIGNGNLNGHREPLFKIVRYLVMSLTIISALIYLRVAVLDELLITFELIPYIISIILVLILGITITEFIIYLLKVLFNVVGVVEYLEIYSNGHILNIILWVVRFLFYFMLLEIFLWLLELRSCFIEYISTTLSRPYS